MLGLLLLLVVSGCGPRSAEQNLRDGVDALRNERFRRAERRLRAALADDPDHAAAAAHLAVAKWKNGSVPEAIGVMRRTVELAPHEPQLREFLALLLLEAGENREALDVLTDLAPEASESERIVTALAVARWRLGDPESAGALLTAVLARTPDYAPALYNMAVFQRDEMQDAERAASLFQQYLTLDPVPDRLTEARRALAQLERDGAPRIPEDPRTFAQPDTGPRSPFESTSPQLVNRANAAIHRGDLDEAYIHLRTAIRNDANDAHALWIMGEFTEEHLRSPDRAARVWREFVDRFPDDPRVGEARQRLRYLTATDETQIRSLPDDVQPLRPLLQFSREPRRDRDGARREFQRGLQYQAQRDWERAAFHFKRAVEKDDTNVNALIQLANAYENSNELRLAVDACHYALLLRPDLSATRLQAARLLLRLDLRAHALAQLETVLRQDPAQVEAHLLTGMLLRGESGSREQARYHLRRYLELAPDGEITDRVRNWLDGEGD